MTRFQGVQKNCYDLAMVTCVTFPTVFSSLISLSIISVLTFTMDYSTCCCPRQIVYAAFGTQLCCWFRNRWVTTTKVIVYSSGSDMPGLHVFHHYSCFIVNSCTISLYKCIIICKLCFSIDLINCSGTKHSLVLLFIARSHLCEHLHVGKSDGERWTMVISKCERYFQTSCFEYKIITERNSVLYIVMGTVSTYTWHVSTSSCDISCWPCFVSLILWLNSCTAANHPFI